MVHRRINILVIGDLRKFRAGARLRLKAFYAGALLRRDAWANRVHLRIIVGAGGTNFPGWISTDYPLVNIADWNSVSRYFRAGSVEAILAEHVWEHLDGTRAAAAARNCFALLKPGGYLRIAVPDGLHPDPGYIDSVRPGGHGRGSEDHKVLHTHRSLAIVLEEAGFRVTLLEWFDEAGHFHFRDWDPAMGHVSRSTRFDERNARNPTAYTSIIVDALKA